MEMETGSSNHNNGLTSNETLDESEEFCCGNGREMGVAEAALQDVESLRQLIFPHMEEDAWSRDSDDTPTNEMANERNLSGDGQRPISPAMVLSVSANQSDAEDEAPPPAAEQPGVQVVRK
ncbi:hypothetical protein CRUP_016052, partial [Coryphaenoides rupestris]